MSARRSLSDLIVQAMKDAGIDVEDFALGSQMAPRTFTYEQAEAITNSLIGVVNKARSWEYQRKVDHVRKQLKETGHAAGKIKRGDYAWKNLFDTVCFALGVPVTGATNPNAKFQAGREEAQPLADVSSSAALSLADIHRRLLSGVRRDIKDAGRRFRVRGGHEEVRWARRLTGPDNCAFCAMLASRGPVYTSASEAGEGRKDDYHPGCDCEVVVVVLGQPWEGQQEYEALKEVWDACNPEHEDCSLTPWELANVPKGGVPSDRTRFFFDKRWSIARKGYDLLGLEPTEAIRSFFTERYRPAVSVEEEYREPKFDFEEIREALDPFMRLFRCPADSVADRILSANGEGGSTHGGLPTHMVVEKADGSGSELVPLPNLRDVLAHALYGVKDKDTEFVDGYGHTVATEKELMEARKRLGPRREDRIKQLSQGTMFPEDWERPKDYVVALWKAINSPIRVVSEYSKGNGKTNLRAIGEYKGVVVEFSWILENGSPVIRSFYPLYGKGVQVFDTDGKNPVILDSWDKFKVGEIERQIRMRAYKKYKKQPSSNKIKEIREKVIAQFENRYGKESLIE